MMSSGRDMGKQPLDTLDISGGRTDTLTKALGFVTTEKAGQAACGAEEQDALHHAHNESRSDDATSVAGRMHHRGLCCSSASPPPGDTFAVACSSASP